MEMKTPLQPTQLKSSLLPRITLTLDKAVEHELKHGPKLDPNMDRRKLRRTISNRLSAQRSRIRKAQYINDMEKMVNDLEEMISVLTPRIECYEEKRMLLLLQNDSLQKLIEFRTNESNLSEIELEEKRAEVCRLRELEKTVKNYISDHSNLDRQKMQDLIRFKQLEGEPYPYPSQNGLKHLHKLEFNELCQQQLITSSALIVQSGLKMESNPGFKDQQPGFMFKRPIEMSTPAKNQEEEEINQYFNFEEVNVDQTSASE